MNGTVIGKNPRLCKHERERIARGYYAGVPHQRIAGGGVISGAIVRPGYRITDMDGQAGRLEGEINDGTIEGGVGPLPLPPTRNGHSRYAGRHGEQQEDQEKHGASHVK